MITINTNMASLVAQNSFNKATTSMNTALERLSTGYRINSSKDDAAGSAIATKLETKISSYAQATKNAEMGADYLQSSDSTITTMQNMVQRMRDLTEQAANGTYGETERKAMQAEVDGLTAEIYRIKNTTEFNGKKILGEEVPFEIQTDVKMSEISSFAGLSGKTVGISSADDLVKLSTLTNSSDTTGISFVLTNDIDMSSVPNFTPIGTNTNQFKGTFEGNGFEISNLKVVTTENAGLFGYINGATIKNVSLKNVDITSTTTGAGGLSSVCWKSEIENCSVTGKVSSHTSAAGGLIGTLANDPSTVSNCSADCNVISTGNNIVGVFVGNCVSSGTIIENCASLGGSVEGQSCGGFMGMANSPVQIVNSVSYVGSIAGEVGAPVGAFIGGAFSSITCTDCYYDTTKINSLPAVGMFGPPSTNVPTGMPNPKNPIKDVVIDFSEPEISVPTNLQVGIQADKDSVISIDTGFAIGNFKIDLSSDEKAQKSLASIDQLMDKMTAKKTDIGASLNRLESVLEQQNTMITSMTNALSQIKDADIALESANYVKNQILQQTTASLLATANQNPNIALNLL